MKICVRRGHGLATDYGATGILDESKETRKVQDVVIKYLQLAGQNVLKARIDYPSSVNQSLAYRVNQSDNWGADVYVEIHLNCGGGHGTETFCVGNGRGREIAQRIVNNIASLGYTNRGVKDGSRLYAVRRPQASSVLVECCFVDSQEDANRWNVESIGKAIAEGILGHSINGVSPSKTVVNNSSNHSNSNNREVYFDMSKKFINGSTIEKIWSNNLHEIQTGYLDPHEECKCIGIHSSGHGIVMYTSTNGYDKIGFTTCHVKLCSDGIVRPID